jgi:hypothetical protein
MGPAHVEDEIAADESGAACNKYVLKFTHLF